uniref:ribonuclease H n=1 Tax=Knipowitschia caucasica TaxID=637954 RepID=A0AAV2MF67_KNICA
MQRSLDPLADFYERTQRSGETACSFAIALEATLREVEDTQNRGRPFPDRDAKLVRQFMRGLIEEDVFLRIAPMKPRMLCFRELQNELRNIAREAKKFNQPRQKKTFSQVQTVTNRQDFEGHLQRLQLVFDRLRKHGLKLKPSKCHLMKKEVQYLGHRVCAEGIRTDPEKISKVKDWPQPTNRKEVLRFLGFAGYYRRALSCPQRVAEESEPPVPSQESEPYADTGTECLPSMTKQDIRAAQREDLVVGPVLSYKAINSKPSKREREAWGGQASLLLKEWRKLVVRDGNSVSHSPGQS